ncbi:MAG: hypothetical protein H0V97_10500, partial [Actinobacteria bacterium]|nr:hypothetical protein [Actinomycetota bacterium]
IGQGIAVAQAIGGSIQLGDKPLKELTPEHAAEVLTQVPLTYWVLLLVIAFLATHSLFRAAQVVTGLVQGRPRWRANRVGWQMMMLLMLLVFLFLLIQMVAPVMTAFVLILVIVGSLLRTVSRFLAESLGDVQVYSERDENSEHYAAREAVLEEAEKTFALVAERRYVEIVVLGHSLGSVVAFTALDRLRRRVPPLLHHIEAIITFGTALEKVRYFFERRKDPDEEASARLVQPAVEIANDRVWLNLWYANDLVANPITTFQAPGADPKGYKFGEQPRLPELLTEARTHLVVNINFGYPVARFPLVWTHSRYWGDKEAMQLITDVALPQ